MEVIIKTGKYSVYHEIIDSDDATNDELSRIIMALESIKLEILERINYDYEIFKKE